MIPGPSERAGGVAPIVCEVRPHVVVIAAAAVAAAVVAVEPLVAKPDAGIATARLTLDGATLRPELAITPEARSVGLMNRKPAPRDGMLFVFEHPTSGGFWMKNTLVPLTIVFFDRNGRRVRRLSMVPCLDDPCKIYDPGRVYRFALELPGETSGRRFGSGRRPRSAGSSSARARSS